MFKRCRVKKATDTIHKKIEKLIVKDLQKKPENPGFLAPSSALGGGIWYNDSNTLYLFIRLSEGGLMLQSNKITALYCRLSQRICKPEKAEAYSTKK